jgi:SAM-dependent methyltransferase
MKIASFLERSAAAYELTQRLITLNYRLFLRELRAEGFFVEGVSYLDVGCGTGFLRDYLRSEDYLGIDLNPAYIEAAKRKRGGCFQVGDALELRKLPRQFGRIVCIGLLHHLDDSRAVNVLSQLKSALKPQGDLFVIDALWPSDKNKIGQALRRADNGSYVRTLACWETLFRADFNIRVCRSIAQWPFDYVLLRAFSKSTTVSPPEKIE